MTGLETIGKFLLVAGGVIALLGLLFILGDRIPLIGRLPGDISIKTDSVRIYVPLATMLLFSLVLTILINILGRLFR